MLKLISTGGTLTAGQTIPLEVEYSTNNNLSYTDNEIVVNKPGLYQIIASFNVTPKLAGSYSIQLYANGSAVAQAITTIEFSDDLVGKTMVLTDVERILPGVPLQFVEFTFEPSADATLTSANVQVVRLK